MLSVAAKEINPFLIFGRKSLGSEHGILKREAVSSDGRPISTVSVGADQARQEELIHGLFKREADPCLLLLPIAGLGGCHGSGK